MIELIFDMYGLIYAKICVFYLASLFLPGLHLLYLASLFLSGQPSFLGLYEAPVDCDLCVKG